MLFQATLNMLRKKCLDICVNLFWKWGTPDYLVTFLCAPPQVHLPGQAGRTLVPSSVCVQQEAGKTGSSRCSSTGSDWRGWESSPHWGAYPSWGTDLSVVHILHHEAEAFSGSTYMAGHNGVTVNSSGEFVSTANTHYTFSCCKWFFLPHTLAA